LNASDFQGSNQKRQDFIDWIESMDDDTYQEHLDEFSEAQKSFALSIREEQKEDEQEGPVNQPSTPQEKSQQRKGVIAKLRRLFGF